MRRSIQLLAMSAVMLVAAWYIYTHGHEFLLLKEFDLQYLPFMLLVALSSLAINGLILRLLVQQFSVRLNVQEWYGLTTIHAFANYLPIPQAGSVARGVYLKKIHKLPYSSFTATLLVAYLLCLAAVGVLGLLTLTQMNTRYHPAIWSLWGLFSFLTATILLLSPATLSLPVISRWSSLVDGLGLLRRRHIFLTVAFQQALLILTSAFGLWLAFQALNRPVSWSASLLLMLVAIASGVIRITPGNLGVAEAAAWLTAHLIQTDADEAVVAFTLFRLIAVIPVFCLAPYYFARLTGRIKEDERTVEETT